MCTHSRTFGLAVPVESDGDDELRAAAFLYIDRQRAAHGDRIPWKVLQACEFNGQRRALITQRGIRWISGMPALTFTTTYSPDPTQAPYGDGFGEDGFPRYKYQGTEPGRADSVSMKVAERLGKPLVWFVGTGEGVYATYPVYVVARMMQRSSSRWPSTRASRRGAHPLRRRGRVPRRPGSVGDAVSRTLWADGVRSRHRRLRTEESP